MKCNLFLLALIAASAILHGMEKPSSLGTRSQQALDNILDTGIIEIAKKGNGASDPQGYALECYNFLNKSKGDAEKHFKYCRDLDGKISGMLGIVTCAGGYKVIRSIYNGVTSADIPYLLAWSFGTGIATAFTGFGIFSTYQRHQETKQVKQLQISRDMLANWMHRDRGTRRTEEAITFLQEYMRTSAIIK